MSDSSRPDDEDRAEPVPGSAGEVRRRHDANRAAWNEGAADDTGLRIEHLGEHRERYRDIFPGVAEEVQNRLPMTFSILARKV